MKFLEGKSQKEKNKIILAVVLGILAVVSLTYTLSGFFVSGKKTTSASARQTPSPTKDAERPQPLNQDDINSYWLTTPVSYNPSAFLAPEPTRNIFAFYEPPPPDPFQPTPIPTVELPKPTPTPPLTLTSITPQSVYAGTKSLKLQVSGANFTPDTYIFWNGIQLPTNFVNSQVLTADVPATLIANEGAARIEVRSPDGKLYSLPLILNVQPPPRPQFKYVGLIARRSYNN
ncbi:MAG: IPT/TIG domain-containing protein, partial [Pyrinomonadaceae bacterium]